MTVRLLADWTDPVSGKRYKPNHLLTRDTATETGLVNAKLADTNLTGGVAWVDTDTTVQQFPVNGQTNRSTGESEINIEGIKYPLTEKNKPILVIGGDHPYAQWWGTNGKNGLAQMLLDNGIRPYIAVCEDQSSDNGSGAGATLGKASMLTYEQALTLQKNGVEFVNHAARHIHFWELVNTGVKIWYSGAQASPTVNITATQVDLTHAGGTSSVTFAAAPTLNDLKTAIAAVAGWNCELATELVGDEPSAALMELVAARSVADLGVSDVTDSNQRFALSGGLYLIYEGAAYREICLSNDGSFLSVYADGVRLAAINITAAATDSLAEMKAAIDALAIAGLTCLVTDNGYAAQAPTVLNPGQKYRETYCFGDEKVSNFARFDFLKIGGGLRIDGGMGFEYTMSRLIDSCHDRTAAQGVKLKAFAQPGGRFYKWMTRTLADKYTEWRGNRDVQATPGYQVANRAAQFSGHFTSLKAWLEADVGAMLYALADSPGFEMNWLNHLCTPTPADPSGYSLATQPVGNYTSADQDEGPYWREIKLAAALRDAGLIDIKTPSEAAAIRYRRQTPNNLVFNPLFKSGRTSLLGIATGADSQGLALPGWFLSTAAANFTAVDVSSGVISMAINGALAGDVSPIKQTVFLEPGETYDIGAVVNLRNLGAGKTCYLALYSAIGGMGDMSTIGKTVVTSRNFFQKFVGDAGMTFTVPPRVGPVGARAVSLVGPWDLSSGNTIKVNYDNLGQTADITLTGATPTATTATEVAAAINAAIKATAAYAGRSEYHDCAKSDGNRLVIELPRIAAGENTAQVIDVINGTGGTKLTTIFGGSAVRAVSRLDQGFDTSLVGYQLALVLPTGCTGSLSVKTPYCRRVRN